MGSNDECGGGSGKPPRSQLRALTNERIVNLGTCLFRSCATTLRARGSMTAMSLLRHLSRPRQYVCQQCIRRQHTLARGERPKKGWAAEDADVEARSAAWQEQAGRIRSGAQQSMLSVLEERGFVKDVAG
jgi:hypothetical protein